MTEMHLKFVLLLPLQEMALRRVAVLLWTGSDILAEILELKLRRGYRSVLKKYLKPIENKVKDKVLKLGLPESLTRQMIDIVQPIGMKISEWKCYEESGFYFSREFSLSVLSKLCWTAAGAIDDQKTAEGLVRCHALPLVIRYRIACTHCLVDYIPLLWEELPEMKKRFFNNNSECVSLEFCWPHILSGELSNLDHLWKTSDRNLTSFNQWAFEYSANRVSKIAAHYFFEKLTHGEREASLVRTALDVTQRDPDPIFEEHNTFCYLLSLMTPEQQMEVLNVRPMKVFLCFLVWPRQNLFLHNARIVLNIVPPTRHAELLHAMAHKLAYFDFYSPKLVHEFFRQIPLHLKKVFVDEAYFPARNFLCMFFRYHDSDSIKVLFRTVDAADRVKIILHDGVLNCLLKRIVAGRWALVELCLREAALSREDGERLKDRLRYLWYDGKPTPFNDEKLKSFFESLEEADARAAKEKKAVKRKLENGCME